MECRWYSIYNTEHKKNYLCKFFNYSEIAHQVISELYEHQNLFPIQEFSIHDSYYLRVVTDIEVGSFITKRRPNVGILVNKFLLYIKFFDEHELYFKDSDNINSVYSDDFTVYFTNFNKICVNYTPLNCQNFLYMLRQLTNIVAAFGYEEMAEKIDKEVSDISFEIITHGNRFQNIISKQDKEKIYNRLRIKYINEEYILTGKSI